MWVLTLIQHNNSMIVSVSECRGLPVLCKAYLQEVVFEYNQSDHEI